ncbi:three component ABC system middle component [Mesorhizobium caraganae]
MRLTAKTEATTSDVDDIRRAAGLLGRWFANQGAPVQILQTMGVTP